MIQVPLEDPAINLVDYSTHVHQLLNYEVCSHNCELSVRGEIIMDDRNQLLSENEPE